VSEPPRCELANCDGCNACHDHDAVIIALRAKVEMLRGALDNLARHHRNHGGQFGKGQPCDLMDTEARDAVRMGGR
jgi:hypothetical protein